MDEVIFANFANCLLYEGKLHQTDITGRLWLQNYLIKTYFDSDVSLSEM